MNKPVTRPLNKQGTQSANNQGSVRITKRNRRQEAREEQRRREAERRHEAQRQRVTAISVTAAVVVAVIGIYFLFFFQGGVFRGIGANSVVNPAYPSIDGISCDGLEQSAFHHHAHLTIYMNGAPVALPQNLGIAPDGSCLYWLHTHDTTGVIHIEAPRGSNFTLGNFFNEWQQRFLQLSYPSELDSIPPSQWQAYVNGKLFTGDFHSITLDQHTLITLMYNSPNAKPDTTYSWGSL